MSNMDYYFAVIVFKDGTRWPCIRMRESGISRLVEHLGANELQVPENVLKFVDKLNEGKGKEIHFVHHTGVSLEIRGNEVKIFEDSTEPNYCTLSIYKLKEILNGWYNFLLAYENAEIPGIIPRSKEGELVIVPISAVKDAYWEEKDISK